jgi:hypothetical protein
MNKELLNVDWDGAKIEIPKRVIISEWEVNPVFGIDHRYLLITTEYAGPEGIEKTEHKIKLDANTQIEYRKSLTALKRKV